MRLGIAAIARSTFDVPHAEATLARVLATLDGLGATILGFRGLVFERQDLERAEAALRDGPIDQLVVLQVTFADATMVLDLAASFEAPILLWGFPEPRWGGRPRLNSLCGINLAAHALGRAGRTYGHLYAAPDDDQALRRALEAPAVAPPAPTVIDSAGDTDAADRVLAGLSGSRIGLVGRHPDGFETCRYDAGWLADRLGIEIEPIALGEVFDRARALSAADVAPVRARAERQLDGLEAMELDATTGTLRLYEALRRLAEERGLAGLAVRCWPETFTEMGCAVCGAMGFLNEDRLTCACEADVLGDVTNLILQRLADAPPWMVDLVDLEPESDTGVLWHCGMAPIGMADPVCRPRADVHANRQKPLLQAFPLRPGRITLARLSQARNEPKLVIGGGGMIRAPMSYCGTSGVVRFDRPVAVILDRLMGLGLEHHLSLAYGEHRPTLRALADRLGLPLVDLC